MFEEHLQKAIFSQQSERTFIDKILAKADVDAIKDIVKKPKLKREELLELLYLLSGVEAKLLNFGEWDRYVILKFFVWIREFIKIAELLYDYQDDLMIKENTCKYCLRERKKCNCMEFSPTLVISKRTRKLLDNNERLIEHNAKFLIDLYLNIGRTTLSLGATGLLELLKNKYEVVYPNQAPTQEQKEAKTSIFSIRK